MQVDLTMNKFRVRDTTINVTVPPNDIAKLMYYLSCVYEVLFLQDLIPYINYQYYYNLLNEQIYNVINYAKLFNPTKMASIKAFILDDNVYGIKNRFYEITDETYGIHANEEFVIGGKIVKIAKIMVYRTEWVIENYYLPLQRITNPVPLAPFPMYPYNNNYNNNYNADDELICCCTIF